MNESSIDKYGFSVRNPDDSPKPASALQINARREKWEKMLSNWEKYKKNKLTLLKSRVRKGISDCLRGRAWLLLTNAMEIKKTHPRHLYHRLCLREEEPPCIVQIEKDLDRTYPTHELFKSNIGQDSLRSILRAYAFFDPEVGYTQGMAYIVGTLRIYMDEESTFWTLIAIMYHYDMRGMFKDGMEKVYQSFYKANALLRIYEFKVWKRFSEIGFYTQIFATQWFMTIFSNFPIEVRLRIWDCFFFEGPKIMYRTFLAVFRANRKLFKDCTFENSLRLIRDIEAECQPEEILKAGFTISLSRKKLVEIEREYLINPDPLLVTWK